jgi:hypothetical protein
MNQVGEVLPLDHADILHTGNRIVSQLESSPLNSGKPTFKTRKVQRNLLPRIDYENRTWCLQLCSPPRSAMTGIIGGATGSPVICQAKGEVMSVRRFAILGRLLQPIFMMQAAHD